MSRRAQGRAAHGPDAEAAAAAPRKAILRTPSRVANVWMPKRLSPSTSARSFVIAMTVANTVTKHVMNLRVRQRALMQVGHAHRIGVQAGACQEQLVWEACIVASQQRTTFNKASLAVSMRRLGGLRPDRAVRKLCRCTLT